MTKKIKANIITAAAIVTFPIWAVPWVFYMMPFILWTTIHDAVSEWLNKTHDRSNDSSTGFITRKDMRAN